MIRIDYKPLSTNQVWKGKRFKSDLYKQYERDLLFILPKMQLPPGPYKLSLVFGLSNPGADIDNGIKQLIDILQKKYGFNDKLIDRLEVDKTITPKGKEFIMYKIEHHTPINLNDIC